MKPLCVIPARAGSKRLRNKNLLPLGGVPMIAHTITAALDSGIFDKVYVSTENHEIARVARTYGATLTGLRPDKLADDMTTTTEVALHLLEQVPESPSYDVIYCLQPSSPLRSAAHVRGAWDVFVAHDHNFLVSVTPIDPHYFHWALHEGDSGWGMFFGDRFLKDRLELPAVQRPNGAIKIAKVAPLRATGPFYNFFGSRLGVFEMPEAASVHVATEIDFRLCEMLLAQRQ
jgi:CMP-N,N'-diacetyllegionaminic acid synthase